ncbi:uncharacterized protein [Prorops nasuta]|uniref:uncharacterized protein n=1 Tax=Prorops nasuta TaxID=863751 RepID=UPI0034CF58EE
MNRWRILLFVPLVLTWDNVHGEFCGGSYFGYQNTVTSPGYPGNYTGPLNCIFEFQGGRFSPCEQKFHLQFLDLDLRRSKNCALDYVLVEGKNVFCEKVNGVQVFTGRNNTLRVIFRAASGFGHKGFKILVTALPCINDKNTTLSTIDKTGAAASNNNIVVSNPEEIQNEVSQNPSDAPRVSTFLFLPPSEGKSQDFRSGAASSTLENQDFRFSTNFIPPLETRNQNFRSSVDTSDISQSNLVNFQYATSISPVETSRVQVFQPGLSTPLENYRRTSGLQEAVDGTSCISPKCDAEENLPVQTGSDTINATDRFIWSHARPADSFYSQTAISGSNVIPGSVYGPSATGYSSVGVNYAPPLNAPTNYVNSNFDYAPRPSSIPITGSVGGSFPGYPVTQACCSTVYASRNFLLISPGFPNVIQSTNTYECTYTIQKYSPQVCRLQLTLKYFNHGSEDPFCSQGYVEVDGRPICGCKSGQTFSFDFPYLTKVIAVRNLGFPRNKFAGFVIEAYQDLCNGYPGNTYLYRNKKDVDTTSILEKSFNTTNENINDFNKTTDFTTNQTIRTRRSSAKLEVNQVKGMKRRIGGNDKDENEDVEYIEEEDLESDREKRNLGYFYPKPSSYSWNGRDVVNGDSRNANLFWGSCQSRVFFDWALAAKHILLRNAQCLRNNRPGIANGGWIPSNGVPGTSPRDPWYPVGPARPIYPSPGNPVYPGDTPIYPGGRPTYPGGNPSYPGGGPSYPGGSPSYPGGSPSYPGGSLPYPGGGPVYPGGGSPPYPGRNPVYPGGSPSYPGGNPGYPGGNPTYPGRAPVYPGGVGNPGYPGAVNCENIDVLEGVISSPLYPNPYPNNVNVCYRFYQAPGYCQLRLEFLDFDLEPSTNCAKDYITYNGANQRYCGRSLLGNRVFLDLSRSSIIDVRFVSDSYGSGRGFNVGFSQIACRGGSVNF